MGRDDGRIGYIGNAGATGGGTEGTRKLSFVSTEIGL